MDVLPPEEYAHAHIAGAMSLPLKELTPELVRARLDPNRPIVVYSRNAEGLTFWNSRSAHNQLDLDEKARAVPPGPTIFARQARLAVASSSGRSIRS